MTFGRAKSFRASLTLPSLLVHTLRVLADVFSLSNYFIAVVPRYEAGGVGKRAFDSVTHTVYLLTSRRLETVLCATAMGVVGIWCMHFIGYVRRKPSSLIHSDISTATALLRLAMDVIHYSWCMLPGLQRSLCFCL